MNNEKSLDLSWKTIVKIVFIFLCFYFFYLLKDVLLLFLFALIISILLEPAIDFLERKRFSRSLATIFVYLVIFCFLSFLIYLIIPPFISEIQQFIQIFPQYFEKISPPLKELGVKAFEDLGVFIQTFRDWLVSISATIFSGILAIFGGIFSTISILTLAIFLSLEENGVKKIIKLLTPKKYESFILDLWGKSQKKAVYWFGTRILSCLAVGIVTFITCAIFDIKYKVFFGFLAGALEILPIIGPILAGMIILIFVWFEHWPTAIFLLLAFILIQQIEANILTPLLTKKFVGLPPVLVLLSLMIGGKLWGILGAILIIPLTGIIYEFLKGFLEKRKVEMPESV